MSEGRFDLSTFRSERTNEASTLTITPKRSSSRDVGLRSEDLAGQSIWQISSLSRNSSTRRALCGFELSSIKMSSEPHAPLKRHRAKRPYPYTSRVTESHHVFQRHGERCIGKDPYGEGYAAEELRASPVTPLRNALPKAAPEVEGLGCGWLGSGACSDPWLQPWTVPGSTLLVFPRCLALMNPPAVTLGTLEKCGNPRSQN
ncbi:hypothetical protein TNCV_3742221 [Trichonephila clavipes]|nr:hypothetical protein TNCV_3742221 [Trichonephila clavipes]